MSSPNMSSPNMSFPTEYWYENYTYDPDDIVKPCDLKTNHHVVQVVGPYIHSLICIFGLVGNSLVIATYALYKRSRSMTDVYLLNVAVADLLFMLTLPPLIYNQLWAWPMGTAACKLLRGSYSVNLYSGMLLLACISVDRYIAIVQARRSFRLRSLAYSRLVCAVIWTAALLISVPTFYFYTRYEPTHIKSWMVEDDLNISLPEPSQYVCEFKFSDPSVSDAVKVAVPATQLAVGFFLPLSIIIFCYSAVIATLMKARNFQRHKAVRVVLAVVLVFVACRLPYNMVLLYDTAQLLQHYDCSELEILQVALTVSETLAYLHCCLNPLLYAFIGVRFRNHFRRVFVDLWCLGKSFLSPRRLSRVTSDTYVSTRSNDTGSSFTM